MKIDQYQERDLDVLLDKYGLSERFPEKDRYVDFRKALHELIAEFMQETLDGEIEA